MAKRTNRHIIQKLAFELHLAVQSAYHPLADKIGNVVSSSLTNEIEKVLNEVDQPGRIFRINQLKIDLGQLPDEGWNPLVEKLFLIKLKEALLREINQALPTNQPSFFWTTDQSDTPTQPFDSSQPASPFSIEKDITQAISKTASPKIGSLLPSSLGLTERIATPQKQKIKPFSSFLQNEEEKIDNPSKSTSKTLVKEIVSQKKKKPRRTSSFAEITEMTTRKKMSEKVEVFSKEKKDSVEEETVLREEKSSTETEVLPTIIREQKSTIEEQEQEKQPKEKKRRQPKRKRLSDIGEMKTVAERKAELKKQKIPKESKEVTSKTKLFLPKKEVQDDDTENATSEAEIKTATDVELIAKELPVSVPPRLAPYIIDREDAQDSSSLGSPIFTYRGNAPENLDAPVYRAEYHHQIDGILFFLKKGRFPDWFSLGEYTLDELILNLLKEFPQILSPRLKELEKEHPSLTIRLQEQFQISTQKVIVAVAGIKLIIREELIFDKRARASVSPYEQAKIEEDFLYALFVENNAPWWEINIESDTTEEILLSGVGYRFFEDLFTSTAHQKNWQKIIQNTLQALSEGEIKAIFEQYQTKEFAENTLMYELQQLVIGQEMSYKMALEHLKKEKKYTALSQIAVTGQTQLEEEFLHALFVDGHVPWWKVNMEFDKTKKILFSGVGYQFFEGLFTADTHQKNWQRIIQNILKKLSEEEIKAIFEQYDTKEFAKNTLMHELQQLVTGQAISYKMALERLKEKKKTDDLPQISVAISDQFVQQIAQTIKDAINRRDGLQALEEGLKTIPEQITTIINANLKNSGDQVSPQVLVLLQWLKENKQGEIPKEFIQVIDANLTKQDGQSSQKIVLLLQWLKKKNEDTFKELLHKFSDTQKLAVKNAFKDFPDKITEVILSDLKQSIGKNSELKVLELDALLSQQKQVLLRMLRPLPEDISEKMSLAFRRSIPENMPKWSIFLTKQKKEFKIVFEQFLNNFLTKITAAQESVLLQNKALQQVNFSKTLNEQNAVLKKSFDLFPEIVATEINLSLNSIQKELQQKWLDKSMKETTKAEEEPDSLELIFYFLDYASLPPAAGAYDLAAFEKDFLAALQKHPKKIVDKIKSMPRDAVLQNKALGQLQQKVYTQLVKKLQPVRATSLNRYFEVIHSLGVAYVEDYRAALHLILYAAKNNPENINAVHYITDFVKLVVRENLANPILVIEKIEEGLRDKSTFAETRKELMGHLTILKNKTRVSKPLKHQSQKSPSEQSKVPYPYKDGALNQPIFIKNAGLVLLWPFLSHYFGRLNMLNKENTFKTPELASRAVHLLQYLATKHPGSDEHELMLNKILCGIPIDMPVEYGISLTDEERDLSESLLRAVIKQWKAMGNSSIDGLRGGFLIRDGRLEKKKDGKWRMQVEKKPYDILLGKLPWSYSMVKISWMPKRLTVEWG